MVIKSVAINAYQNAMDLRRRSVDNTVAKQLQKPQAPVEGFNDTLKESLTKVNNLEAEKRRSEERRGGKE